MIRRAEPSRPSASRSSSGTPYRRPSGRASPRPSRSAALASSSSGRVSRRACSTASATATATAASASAPIRISAPVSRPYWTESSAATVTRKFRVTACLMIASPARGGSPMLNSCSPSCWMLMYRSGSDLATRGPASAGSPASTRSCSALATVVASRCTCLVAPR